MSIIKKYHLLLLFILINQFVKGQTSTIYGYVSDLQTGDKLQGVAIEIKDIELITSTDKLGFYSIKIPNGIHTIVFSYIGYTSDTLHLNIKADTKKNISLAASSNVLGGVEVSADKYQNINRIETSVNRLSAATIKSVPAMLGEVDIIKALQYLPGVQTTAEGSSNFSVRGGGYDQNLILLDNTPIYSSSHLLGFFSVFNNDIIEDVKLYKGDIPVSFGGRMSSLMDIKTKEGNKKRFGGFASIGTISSRLMLQTPLYKDKASFFVSARRTYADIFLKMSKDKNLNNTKLYFYDINAKADWQIGKNDYIFLSAYIGDDMFKNQLAGMSYGNKVLTSGWRHTFSQKLIANTTLFVSNYKYHLSEDILDEFSFDWWSELMDIGGKIDFTLLPSSIHTLKFGYQATYRKIDPGKGGGSGDKTYINNKDFKTPPQYSIEQALYTSHQVNISDIINIRYGVRFSLLSNLGNDSLAYVMQNYAIKDSFQTKKGKIYKTNYSIEPRISINYLINKFNSLKMSYSNSAQYLQVASNSTSGSPLDIWFSASNNVKPQICNQFVLGYAGSFLNGQLQASVEAYYKHYSNTIDFKERAFIRGNGKIERELRFGKGYSAGIEVMLSKPAGKINGWISYTFSRSYRKVEGVNNNEWYRSPYDKPHNISIVANYEITPRWQLSATWLYTTGQPVTYPEGRYWVGNLDGSDKGKWVPIPSKRNAYRFPDFHRLDLAVNWKISNPMKKVRHELNLSIYNVYARKNPWTIYFEQQKDNPNLIKAKMIYLFSIVPSLSWNISF